MTQLATIRDDFALLDDWEDRYRYIIELGRDMPSLAEAEKTAANKVEGCASQVWLVTESDPAGGGRLRFRGDSDAHIVRGLVAIITTAYDGLTPAEVAGLEAEPLLASLGLDAHLSSQRANGLRAMVRRIKQEAARRAA
ncbi:MAG: SufE family protein [Rhizobiaceae bacterium]|jgi:cysteine desulfuration protein SufE|nr:SufE family protein [Rhizobiaceae bacterium]